MNLKDQNKIMIDALERIALDIDCDGPECHWCDIGSHPSTIGAIIAKQTLDIIKEV